MNFSEIFTVLTDTYGIMGLIIFLLITGLFILTPYMFNKNNKSMNNAFENLTTSLTKSITEQNGNLINTIKENENMLIKNQVEIIHNLLDKKDEIHSKHMDIRDSISIPIQNKINHLKDYYNCSRVSVIEFHNSLYNMNGLPFKSYDLIYESIKKGVKPMSAETKNMPFNIMSPITSLLTESTDIIVFNKENIESFYEQSSVLYAMCQRLEVIQLIVAPLMNKDENLIGIIMLEFSKENEFKNHVTLEELELESHAISTLLEIK